MKTTPIASLCILICCYVTLCSGENMTELEDMIKKIDPCLAQAVYSFNNPRNRPPTTISGLEKSCQSQAEGLKCLKAKIKTAPPLVKRGMTSFIQTRQRYNKKYCTDLKSDLSKQLVRGMKCIMEKRFAHYKEIDAVFANTLNEMRRRNYTDASLELKYLCCTLITFRKNLVDGVGKECEFGRSMMEEMVLSIVPNDINLICDDEDKVLTKVCPKIEPYKNIGRTFDPEKGMAPSGAIFYIALTLGEPEPGPVTR